MVERPPLIIGIGASAGGVPALEGFFGNLHDAAEMAFVIVTHLSPQRISLLHQVIGRLTNLPVAVADDGVRVEGGNVYVMPENVVLTIAGGRLRLRALDPMERERKPVDVFFSALAEDQAENAIGIIMSGGDSDGTLGVKAIKQRGGVTFAQVHDASGPRNPEMPESAIGSGLVDFALPVERMAAKLVEVRDGRAVFDRLVDAEETDAERLSRTQDEISLLLRNQSGHDFSGYKSKSFMRRVGRRMQLLQLGDVDAYIARLREEPTEITALFRDLLINVTEFFRDPEAFEALGETVIPRLLEGRGADESVRIWVPGCATGEEVYSIGILLRERMEKMNAPPRAQIFATDIDEATLAVARAGRYPEQMLKGLTPERRERFFTRDGAGWTVRKQLRDICVFSPHSVISDPPFSRMDLISCRNLLIYLGRDLQYQVIPTFHYALKPGGYLFLGTSESVSQHTDLFTPISKKHRIFLSRGQSDSRRLPMTLDGTRRGPRRHEELLRNGASAHQFRQRIETQILERHTPAHVVIRKEGEIVYYSARTSRFLEMPRGAPSRQLVDVVRRELRLELRSALRQAMDTGRFVERLVPLRLDGDAEHLAALTVEPMDGRAEGEEPLYLVVFSERGPPADSERAPTTEVDLAAKAEQELREMRDRLQSTVEEYETALEELKSSNEELVSVNEEAQSTNEELEASKEEMQSLNEELVTINAELSVKVEELDRANTDLKNLYEATRIATIFLDDKLVIRDFTPAASAFFNLRDSDIGRPLTDLASALDYPDLRDHIDAVFASGAPFEHRLRPAVGDEHYLVRLVPYRNRVGDVSGVVVTLVDVTSLGRAEAHQKILIAELNHRVKNALTVVISVANATLRYTKSPEDFVPAFTGRLHGMARAYTLLSNENWGEIDLHALLSQETAAHGTENVTIEGPAMRLSPARAVALGMVVHELATNAVKYGALNCGVGRVEIRWTIGDGRACFEWRETGGPEVTPPEETGFGFRLIETQVRHQLRGEFSAAFATTGLEARIVFPLERSCDEPD